MWSLPNFLGQVCSFYAITTSSFLNVVFAFIFLPCAWLFSILHWENLVIKRKMTMTHLFLSLGLLLRYLAIQMNHLSLKRNSYKISPKGPSDFVQLHIPSSAYLSKSFSPLCPSSIFSCFKSWCAEWWDLGAWLRESELGSRQRPFRHWQACHTCSNCPWSCFRVRSRPFYVFQLVGLSFEEFAV